MVIQPVQHIIDLLVVYAEQVLVVVLPLLASLASAWLVAQIKLKIDEIKANKHAEVGYVLENAVSMGISAAEGTLKSGEGKAKKDAAVELATAYLAARGVKLDVALIEGAIEAAVFDELNKFDDEPDDNPE